MMQGNFKDEWLDKAFQLAFFLHNDRETAKKITLRAMNKLETASNAQFKRYYYQPTGRAENSRATRSRVSMNDLQLLQRLVFVESEEFEKEKKSGEKSLLKFYIKHLVRIALKRNSFYVTLGISRILHNYPTSDAMEIYNIIVQDPERVHDDYYFRSRKGVLMKELKARFGPLLETVRVERGEERFDSKPSAEDFLETARKCLKNFMPWNSLCKIPEKFDPFEDIIAPFYFDKKDPDEEHRIEVNRIHAALDPDCFARLTEALDLPASEQKLEIPRFMIDENYTETYDDDTRSGPPHLEPDELGQIKDILTAQAESRKAMTANLLRVVVDGDEVAKINLKETGRVDFDLSDSAELIEVRAMENDEDMIVATHLLSFNELQKGVQSESVLLENGQKISFDLRPSLDQYGEVVRINCGVEYAEAEEKTPVAVVSPEKGFSFGAWLGNFGWALKPALAFGMILLIFGFGWIIYQRFNQDERAKNPTPANQNEQINNLRVLPPEEDEKPEEKPSVNNSPEPLKKPDEDQTGQNKKNKPVENKKPKTENKPKKEILVVTPPRQLQANKEETGTDKDGILRLPIRETNNFPRKNESRNFTKKITGKSLNEIKQIYIEISGDEILGRQISQRISAELQSSGRFTVTTDKESADAALKIYVRHESDVDDPEEKMVTVIVRLVNAKGFVVYPNRKGVSGWKYVGPLGKLPPRIARELNAGK